ncbi:hypothetical protein EC973_003840 [Apophysomyces ossiformis]|uniref:Uncharacterized protein n=1 Tax=Apophysomyces ossiformis TaxID=679940 RepID=A0A8H7ES47_9FUNG|nr:hypothetical protein EC973_003840 [Apophysomyces ossiformis]
MRTITTFVFTLILAATCIADDTGATLTVDTRKKDVPLKLNEFDFFHWTGKRDAEALETFVADLERPAILQITDFKNRGDMFQVFDNDRHIGQTSVVMMTEDDDTFAETPEDALMDSRFSRGIFRLDSGPHRIVIKANGPFDAGTAAIRLLRPTSYTLTEDINKKTSVNTYWNDWRESQKLRADRWGKKKIGYGQPKNWQEPELKYDGRQSFTSQDHPVDTAHTVTVIKTMWLRGNRPSWY